MCKPKKPTKPSKASKPPKVCKATPAPPRGPQPGELMYEKRCGLVRVVRTCGADEPGEVLFADHLGREWFTGMQRLARTPFKTDDERRAAVITKLITRTTLDLLAEN